MTPPVQARAARLPSIATRLARALIGFSLFWGATVGVAVWLAAVSEVDELLDAGLLSSATLMAALAQPAGAPGPHEVAAVWAGGAPEHFAWQVVGADGRLQLRSPLAPATPWHQQARAGFSDVPAWRLYGVALPEAGGRARMLYAAQTREERTEARAEVALAAVLAALAVGLLGQLWLRGQVQAELRPLQTLSARLARFDVDAGASPDRLGAAERAELAPVHEAVDALVARLATRLSNERAFSAHAAHALRTPLAGIDAQLALALREAAPPLAQRLQRVRDAATRLQGVVAALLGLFRAGSGVDKADVDVSALLARLPAAGLDVQVPPGLRVHADADLLAAALVNLLDNSHRHGARQLRVSQPAPQRLRLHDDGPGVAEPQRLRLQQALDSQAYEGHTGLGLMLADRVARAHGGSVHLPPADGGFAVELTL